MDKSKRSDLLAAGRKKLRQFRQKKDQKGGNKDAQSSNRGSQQDKDADADEPMNTLEPEVATSTSTVESDALTTDTLDPSVVVSSVDFSTANSGEVIDHIALDDGKALERVAIEPPVVESSSSALDIDKEEAKSYGMEQCNGESSEVGIPAVENRMYEAGGITLGLALETDGQKVEASTVEPGPDLAVSQALVGWSSLPVEIDNHTDVPVTSSEKNGDNDDMEQNEMAKDLESSVDLDERIDKEATVLPVLTEDAQEVYTSSYHENEEIPAQASPGKVILLEESLEMPFSNQTAVDENLEVPGFTQPTSDHTSSLIESAEVPLSHENDSAHGEENVSAMGDPEILKGERSIQNTIGEAMWCEGRSSQKPPGEFSSSQEMGEISQEDVCHPIFGSTDLVSSLVICPMETCGSGLADELENVRRHLYLANISRDFLQFQLEVEAELHEDSCKQSAAELSKLYGLLQESQEKNAVANEELAQFGSKLQDTTAAKEKLEIRLLSREQEFEALNNNFVELLNKFEVSQQEMAHQLEELAACKDSLEILQKENVKLTTRLTSEIDARNTIDEEKEFLANENARIVSKLLEKNTALEKQNRHEYSIKESENFDQLAELNLYLSSSLAVHEAKLKELGYGPFKSSSISREAISHETEYRARENSYGYTDSSFMGVLNDYLQEAKDILQSLEKSIEGMHLQSLSLRSDGRAGASGVSKLIRSFETKQHPDIAEEELQISKGGQSDNSYSTMKEQMSCLRVAIECIELEIRKAEVHRVEKSNNISISKKFQMDSQALKKKSDTLEEKIDVLVDQMSSNSCRIQNFQDQFDEIQQDSHDKMEKFLSEIEQMQIKVDDELSTLMCERDSLKAVTFRAIEKLNKYTLFQISDNNDIASFFMASVDAAVELLNNLQEKLIASNLESNTLHNSYNEQTKLLSALAGREQFYSGQMHKLYVSLWELLKESCESIGGLDADLRDEEILQILPERFEALTMHLKKLLDERLFFLFKSNDLESMLLTKNEEIQEHFGKYDALVKRLDDLQRAKNEVDLFLLKKEVVIEEAKEKCIALIRKLEYHKSNMDLFVPHKLVGSDELTQVVDFGDNDFLHSLQQLETLIVFYIQEHEEALELIDFSKKCLLEVNVFPHIPDHHCSLQLPTLIQEDFIPRLCELQDQLDLLCMSNINFEIELQFFKEYTTRMKYALESSHSELHLKVSELELSEQRLSSVREKLSIAVAKGKGLIVQRDNLKQTLLEKSTDLEKCLHELQSKEALLQEVEGKLKSYAEVDRIEALESELSYIRNSATALRDSFLLKDSVLQRIEEVLEDLDLPEHFHARDIVEKVELLSKIAVGNSSITMTDWDQKSSIGGSHSDAGFVIMDSWKEDSQAIPNPSFDELKSKFEQLERKFYSLAEHNEMLEQSLVERNNLVQKWEEMLDSINMPPQLSTLEPELKIECLGNILAEVQHERDALRSKIKDLEASSDILTVDLEESYKKLSEVSAEIVVIKSEKDILSEKLNMLNFEYDDLSEKITQHNVSRDHFQREINNLNEKLTEKVQENLKLHDMENEIWRLLDLVRHAVQESDHPTVPSDDSAIERLELLLRILVDKYTNLVAQKSTPEDHAESVPKDAAELVSAESKFSVSNSGSGDVLHNIEQELNSLRIEHDNAISNLNLMTEERNEVMEKCQFLTAEVEAISKQKISLKEEVTTEIEKNKSLLSQLDVICKEKDALREQLIQEEEKSASIREKLNIAVRKGKGLVQQRDGLKEEIEKMNINITHLNSEKNQLIEALESEKEMLENRLKETGQNLANSKHTLSKLLRALDDIDIGKEYINIDSAQKLEEIGKLNFELRSSVFFAEQEAKKAKRTAELLLAELNEVQERADILHEELGKAEAVLFEAYRQKDAAESARADAFRHLEEINLLHSEERKKQIDSLAELMSAIGQVKDSCSEFSGLIANWFKRDFDLLSNVEAFMGSIETGKDFKAPVDFRPDYPHHEENSIHALSKFTSHEPPEKCSLTENLVFGVECVLHCLSEFNELKINTYKQSFSLAERTSCLVKKVDSVGRKVLSQWKESESLKEEVAKLESTIMVKEAEVRAVHRNLFFIYQLCNELVNDIENGHTVTAENELVFGGKSVSESGKSPSEYYWQVSIDGNTPLTDEVIKSLADRLIFTVKRARSNEASELKATIVDLQRELQEKDAHTSRITAELVSQIRDAEAVARRSTTELESTKTTIYSLEKQVEEMVNDKKSLELRVSELSSLETSLDELNGRIKSLNDSLTAKDQEIETLMEALDEEEVQVEGLENRNKELQSIVEEKASTLEKLEASHEKSLVKLSTTVNKFDELYNLSESLVTEVENLQSQLQSRESDISFLRQEVTRCTNELLASQESNKKHLSEVKELLKWLNMTISRFGLTDVHMNGDENQIHAFTNILDKSITSIMAELNDLRVKVSQQTRRALTGPSEVEQKVQKTEPVSAGVVTHVRTGRKFNNDQIAIAIDVEKGENVIDDEDDDKAHGFKSLTMSRFIPRVSRPIADKIDGMWVSGDRLLMRQPTLRIGVLLYWVALHALLASLI